MGMSYRHAWLLVQAVNEAAGVHSLSAATAAAVAARTADPRRARGVAAFSKPDRTNSALRLMDCCPNLPESTLR